MLSSFFISVIDTTPCGVHSGCYAGNLYLSFLDLICFYWENLNLEFICESSRLFFLIFTIYIWYYLPSLHKNNFTICHKHTLKTLVLIGFSKKIIFNCTICLTVELNNPWESKLNVRFRVQNKCKWKKKKI